MQRDLVVILYVRYMPPYTHRRHINEDKIVPNIDNL